MREASTMSLVWVLPLPMAHCHTSVGPTSAVPWVRCTTESSASSANATASDVASRATCRRWDE
ncbi:Uncharacterised protein [Mycobacteroides abscessus subsp. abscessus]|nr:Uncharacterised protein [Mycobacteroides abscessus subsp. abscessus]